MNEAVEELRSPLMDELMRTVFRRVAVVILDEAFELNKPVTRDGSVEEVLRRLRFTDMLGDDGVREMVRIEVGNLTLPLPRAAGPVRQAGGVVARAKEGAAVAVTSATMPRQAGAVPMIRETGGHRAARARTSSPPGRNPTVARCIHRCSLAHSAGAK